MKATSARCDCVVTRNVLDFGGSPVAALSPTDFLALLPQGAPPPADHEPEETGVGR